ncbi:type I secretion system permease/ATPase [Tabrizicola sp.]|uniref:type I secretion system permease/ATPase n=1 Tax=Tabrizicola sp. TaxID=2005166 RepID=UPI0035AE1780
MAAPTVPAPVPPPDLHPGLEELSVARAGLNRAIGLAFAFSVAVNLLMLTPPLYMLQVYDRVLVSRSAETLLSLTLIAAFLMLALGLLDHARARILARVGARFQAGIDARVMQAALHRLALAPADPAALAAQRDLDALARLWASPLLPALFDAPWTPVFAVLVVLFHPWLGALALGGGAVLVALAWASQRLGEGRGQAATLAAMTADRLADSLRAGGEPHSGTGFARWAASRERALLAGIAASDTAGRFAVTGRTFRLFLQSAMLGLAAWLVLRQELSPGAMIATSILVGRALQPVEQALAHWPVASAALQARRRLAGLLSAVPPPPPRLPLPPPRALLAVAGLSIRPPGGAPPILRGVSFTLAPGQALGVIGASGAGKSALARVLAGVWPVAAGEVRLDGATLAQYGPDRLGRLIGCLPQRVALFDGTVAENIARLDPVPVAEKVIAAAAAAGAHRLILALTDGYDTRLSPSGSPLSGGQLQRLALARALYDDPVLLILDEPNANLDHDGTEALNQAVGAAKARGAAVLVMAHRPAALQECDLLMVLQDGRMAAFGPREEVLRQTVRNAAALARPGAAA